MAVPFLMAALASSAIDRLIINVHATAVATVMRMRWTPLTCSVLGPRLRGDESVVSRRRGCGASVCDGLMHIKSDGLGKVTTAFRIFFRFSFYSVSKIQYKCWRLQML